MNNKKVLDVGSGSAACALASAIAGASQVTANDIDPGVNWLKKNYLLSIIFFYNIFFVLNSCMCSS